MKKYAKSASGLQMGSWNRRTLHLDILRDLVEPGIPDASELFEKGLRLLVTKLLADRAVIVRITELGFETLWWANRDRSELDLAAFDPSAEFSPQVLKHSPRPLIIHDVLESGLPGHLGAGDSPVRSYIGVPLRRGEKVIGILNVQSRRPQRFSRADVTLVCMVASLLGNTMEIELLKEELHRTREALDLTMSVVEDSALEAPVTHLPNRRYLEIWLKAYLFMARRRSEPMALVVWRSPLNRETRDGLKDINDQARGEDLLVDMGKDTYLLLLPRTTLAGAEHLVQRVSTGFGHVPVGVALWDPANPDDQNDLAIHRAYRRAMDSMGRLL